MTFATFFYGFSKDIWEPSLSSVADLEEDNEKLNSLNSGNIIDDELLPSTSLQSTDGQQYVAGYLAQKVKLEHLLRTLHINSREPRHR